MTKTCPIIKASGFILCLFLSLAQETLAFDSYDVASIGAAYATHIFLHEMGHQVVAEDVAADSPRMRFLARRGGQIYPGLSTYKKIPEESKLPYAVAGDRMAGVTFEYALQSYHRKPTTYNKALVFFTCADFLAYTVLGNYVHSDNEMYDPNLIREETGCSKELLLSLVAAKSLLNTYRTMNPDATFAPMIWVDKNSAALLFHFSF